MITYRCHNNHTWEVSKEVDSALAHLKLVLCPTCSEPMTRSANKYGNTVVWLDGKRFQSQREATRYQELIALQSEGVIRDLELQPAYPLVVNGVKIGKYIGDFRYVECATEQKRTEDAKGVRTKDYRIKKKLVFALYRVRIEEV